MLAIELKTFWEHDSCEVPVNRHYIPAFRIAANAPASDPPEKAGLHRFRTALPARYLMNRSEKDRIARGKEIIILLVTYEP